MPFQNYRSQLTRHFQIQIIIKEMKRLLRWVSLSFCVFSLYGCPLENLETTDSTYTLQVRNQCSDSIGMLCIGFDTQRYYSNRIRFFKQGRSMPCLFRSWDSQDTIDKTELFYSEFAIEGARMEIYDKAGNLLRCWRYEDATIEPDNIFNIDNWTINYSRIKKNINVFQPYYNTFVELDEYIGDFDITPEMLGLKE